MHCTEGRDYRRAVEYHCRAGETALRRSAYREAVTHCREGLDLLERLPDKPERQRQELALRLVLSSVLAPTQGFGAEELMQNLSRARELCQALNDDATLVSVLVGLGRSHHMRADREAIDQIMDEEYRLLAHVHEPDLAIQLHTHLGTGNLLRGLHGRAREHYVRTLELYDPKQHRELALRFSLDPAVVASILFGWSLRLAGWPDRARSRIQQGLSLARGFTHPHSLSLALIDAAQVHLWCGDLDGAERLTAEGERVAREHGVALYRVVGEVMQACVRVQRGEPEEGFSMLTKCLTNYRGMNARYLLPLYLCCVTDAYRQMGRVEEGLVTITEAVHLTETLADVSWAAEVHRLRGELTLQHSSIQSLGFRVRRSSRFKVQGSKTLTPNTPAGAEAEACFLKALSIAQQQEAKSLELRAAMSLSRLRRQQGKEAEAGKLLAEIHGWFTEGFDTADLREARALLDDLLA